MNWLVVVREEVEVEGGGRGGGADGEVAEEECRQGYGWTGGS